MQIRSFSVNAFQVNCYVLYHQGEALIVDPGGPAETVLAFLEEKKLKVVAIGNTHGHADHIAGNAWFRIRRVHLCSFTNSMLPTLRIPPYIWELRLVCRCLPPSPSVCSKRATVLNWEESISRCCTRQVIPGEGYPFMVRGF